MMAVFAEFERAMIVERVKAGLSRARSQGKRLGRRPLITGVVERIQAQLATGSGILRTAKVLGVGTGTVHRVKRATFIAPEDKAALQCYKSMPIGRTGRKAQARPMDHLRGI